MALRFHICLVLFFFLGMIAFTQNKVQVSAIVVQDDEPVDGALIEVFKNGEKTETIITKRSGKFRASLDLQSTYILRVSQFGKCTKKIQIDTRVPENSNGSWMIGFDISLFDLEAGVDMSVLDEPVALISYSDRIEDFDYDAKYTALMSKKLEKLHEQLTQLSK